MAVVVEQGVCLLVDEAREQLYSTPQLPEGQVRERQHLELQLLKSFDQGLAVISRGF